MEINIKPAAFHVMPHAYFPGPLMGEHLVNSNLNAITTHYLNSKQRGRVLLQVSGLNYKAHGHMKEAISYSYTEGYYDRNLFGHQQILIEALHMDSWTDHKVWILT